MHAFDVRANTLTIRFFFFNETVAKNILTVKNFKSWGRNSPSHKNTKWVTSYLLVQIHPYAHITTQPIVTSQTTKLATTGSRVLAT